MRDSVVETSVINRRSTKRIPTIVAAARLAKLLLTACGILLTVAPSALASSGTLVVVTDTVLTEDHQGNILVVASDVTLDCANHVVSGPGDPTISGGINVGIAASGVTIRRCAVTGFVNNGIYASGGTDNGIYEDNAVYGNFNHGIALHGGHNNRITRNNVVGNNFIGIVLTQSHDSQIDNNTVQDNANWCGIGVFDQSTGNTISDNTVLRNREGIQILGSSDNVVRGNTTNQNRAQGIDLGTDALNAHSYRNLVESNTVNGNLIGVEVADGANLNEVRDNVANRNTFEGFKVWASDDNTLTGNTANNNGSWGFVVYVGASSNVVTNNVGHNNAFTDGYDDGSGTGNVWVDNEFKTTEGF